MVESERKLLLSGNEALARGAIEAGIGFCSSYPGTPSTEITESVMRVSDRYDIYAEWSVNEKVALEAAAGASWAGVPSLCVMKSLGLNVASDFLLNVNLSGTGEGGLVLVVCDDPRGHSSSNEQDSRFYAKASYLPLLEPSSGQIAKDIVPYAFDVSKRYQIPVIVRSTTRLSHSRSIVTTDSIRARNWSIVEKFPDKLFNVPQPHMRHKELLEKLDNICQEFETSKFNSMTQRKDSGLLILASGIGYSYAKEAATLLDSQNVDVANLVTTYPVPPKTLNDWIKNKKQVLFVEETDPFIEEQILAYSPAHHWSSIEFYGKRTSSIPPYGELDADVVLSALCRIGFSESEPVTTTNKDAIERATDLLIPRPLTFCAGCTHRNVYWAIRKVKRRLKGKIVVTGDIGCYSLGVFYDRSMDTMQSMGSGIGTATGLGNLEQFGFDSKVVAVAGDSTFFHACMPALVDAKHKSADITFIIMDNATTAMTGFQDHPGSRVQKDSTRKVSIKSMVDAINPDHMEECDATDIPSTIEFIWKAVQRDGLKVLLVDSVCRLEERKRLDYERLKDVRISAEECRGDDCKICAEQFACPALSWDSELGIPKIIKGTCIKCGACVMVCPHSAIRQE